jgi:putative DNA primase/helicase
VTQEAPNPGDFVSLGWKVFPCHNIIDGQCSCGKGVNCSSPGKHPRTRNGVKDASNNLDQLRAWWEAYPGTNWGLACGRDSDVVVIDIDSRKGGYESYDELVDRRGDELPDTLTAKTGGGGLHLMFAYPEGLSISNRVNWLPGVDIRSDGGYVILAPGNHISGGVYDWKNWGTARAQLPGDVLALLGGGGSGGLGAEKLADTGSILGGIEEGSRDDNIFRLACRLRRQLNEDREAVRVLVLHAAANASPPFPEREALAKVEQAFRQDHTDDDDIFGGENSDVPDAIDDPIYRLTDMGNRDRFVRAFGDDFRYVTGIGWHQWTDIGWQKIDEMVAHRAAQQVPGIVRQDAERVADVNRRAKFVRWANDSESTGRIQAVITLARGHDEIMKLPDDFDAEPEQLACRNGMVNLRTGALRPFTRDDLFTKNTNVIYDPTFELEAWNRFLEEATRGDQELMDYLQMAAGYTLTGSIAEESFFILSGPTASGKTTYMNGLEAALGTYADVTSADTFMKRYGKDAPREEVVKFAGARLISTEELPEGERFDDAFLKRITGGSKINARYLYQEGFAFTPQFKLWMATNHDPSTSDPAMFRRIKRVPFLYTVPVEKRDRTLKKIMKDPEIGGRAALAWAVRGAIKYFEQGSLIEPMIVKMATMDYQAKEDAFAHFLAETYRTVAGESSVRFVDMYRQYSQWCKDNNERAAKRPQFEQKLNDAKLTVQILDNGDKLVSGIELRVDAITTQIPFQ